MNFIAYPGTQSGTSSATELANASTHERSRPGVAWVSSVFAPKLTTQHAEWFELQLPEGGEFTSDLPNVGEDALAGLDERGVVKPGTHVKEGDVLIGCVRPRGGQTLSSEEKLLRAIFGEKAGDVVDCSQRTPCGVAGVVTSAELEGDRVRVQVSWDRPLEVGDVLDLEGHLATVAAIGAFGSDVVCDAVSTQVRVRKYALARDTLHARFIGPYDLLTQQPMEGKRKYGGQRVSRELMATFATHLPWLAWELVSLRSDTVSARSRAYEALVKRENPGQDALVPEVAPSTAPVAPRPAAATGMRDIFSFFEAPKPTSALDSEAVTMLVAYLRGLGWSLHLEGEARVEVLTPEQLRESSGAVVAGELGSQRIFGPTRDYECECGKYRRMKHRGVVCETCGVEVIQSKVRRERFGHFELPAPLVHPLMGMSVEVVAVLPPELRTRAVEDRYGDLVRDGSQAALEAMFAALTDVVNALWLERLFSKCVDFSGVAHLVVDETLAPGNCRVPREVCVELFRPFVYGVLEERGYVTTIKSARRMVEDGKPEALRACEAVSTGYPLVLAAGDRFVTCSISTWDSPAIAVDAATAALLAAREVQVFLPITSQAALECSRVSSGGGAAPTGAGWLSDARRDASPFIGAVQRAAASGARDGWNDVVVRLVFGKRPALPDVSEVTAWETAWRERERAVSIVVEPPPDERAPSANPMFERSVDELEVSVSTANVLQRLELKTVGDLVRLTEAHLLKTKGFTRKNLKEVTEILAELGLSLGMS